MKVTVKGKLLYTIIGVAFVVYILAVLVLFGVSGHTATFWISFVFMLLAFAAMITAGVMMGKRGMSMRDWLFGYPIIKHSAVYIVLEFIASTVFIIFEQKISPKVAFVVQLVLLGIYLVFAISCFLAKNTIDEIQTKVKSNTTAMRLTVGDIEMISLYAKSSDVKAAFNSLAEQFRYSDPMDIPETANISSEIASLVGEARKIVESGDETASLAYSRKISLLLQERNRKLKAIK